MPEDMGAFDVNRLRKLRAQKNRFALRALPESRPFDESEWSEGPVACVAWSSIHDYGKQLRRMLEDPREDGGLDDASRAELAKTAHRPPTIQRDWYVACGTTMANVWYRTTDADHAAADIADCEDMIRSLSFAR
jgi:hypothetical protein